MQDEAHNGCIENMQLRYIEPCSGQILPDVRSVLGPRDQSRPQQGRSGLPLCRRGRYPASLIRIMLQLKQL